MFSSRARNKPFRETSDFSRGFMKESLELIRAILALGDGKFLIFV